MERTEVATLCVLFTLIKTSVNKVMQARGMSMNPDTVDTIVVNNLISKANEKKESK